MIIELSNNKPELTMPDINVPSIIKLEENEFPVLLVRQHWFVFRNSFLLALFIPFMLLMFSLILSLSIFSDASWSSIMHTVLKWSAVVSATLGFVMFFWTYFLWRYTFYLITNLRIVLVTRYSLFHHDDRETALSMVQDVKAVVDGIEPMLYGFGDVIVQISSEDSQLILHKVGKPREVQRVIIREAHLRD